MFFGISVDKADLDIANLRTFGEKPSNPCLVWGSGYRELRQFRRLQDYQKSANVGAFGKSQTTLLFRFRETLEASQNQIALHSVTDHFSVRRWPAV